MVSLSIEDCLNSFREKAFSLGDKVLVRVRAIVLFEDLPLQSNWTWKKNKISRGDRGTGRGNRAVTG